MLLLALSSGCYTFTPVFGGQPQAGTRVALRISDQGRVALANQVSGGALSIQGTVVGIATDEYLVAVDEVRTIDGAVSHWSGEHVTVRMEHVAGVHERRFSKGRTFAAVAATTGTLVVVALASRLIGGSTAGRAGGDDGGSSGQ